MDAEVGVIGVGTMGSMAMWQMAKQGVSVVGFEQFGIGHDKSAAGGETRIYRTMYKEGSDYVPLLQESYNLWRKLEQESGSRLLEITKGLMIVKQNSISFNNIVKGATTYNIKHDIFSYNQAKQLFPQHNLLPNDVVILDHMAGFIYAQHAIHKAASLAKQNGGKIHTYTQVKEIKVKKDFITVVANNRKYKFRKVIITTGPWISQLFPQYKNQIEIRRLIGHWFATKNETQLRRDYPFIYMREVDEGIFYGLPSLDRNIVKVALSSVKDDSIQSISKFTKDIKVEEISLINDIVKKYLPGLYPDPIRSSTYIEGYTPDNNSIIGEVEGHNNIIIASGFSGHGFKISPLIGKIVTDLVLEKKSPYLLNKFKPNRFLGKTQ